MADHQDVYADGISVTINPISITLTFTRQDPKIPGISEGGQTIVARVRMHPGVGQGVVETINQAIEMQKKQGKNAKETTLKH